ncbi:hypothetical protein M422DRAFT_29359 [Sphaerobolus stellatus SS14]|uniref:Uncharacterized protein n=1 Tax=Sphaerobolus stellatus (strain SS14) TaxID=990650 RepID=A0A0C9VGL5_SPHS4|nr:hypothetical protein M422DRAFT_29359 [Sphaerobolus stellatus SS14]
MMDFLGFIGKVHPSLVLLGGESVDKGQWEAWCNGEESMWARAERLLIGNVKRITNV